MKVMSRRASLDNEINARHLDHENVTKIKEIIDNFDQDENSSNNQQTVIIMEYVGQNNLQSLLEKNKLSSTLVKSFLMQIVKGLNHCHEHLIGHLDLKPANVLVTSTGQCKLADFGCSRIFKDAEEMVKSDQCPGTPGYQAPEILKEKTVNLKSDVYSLGILMWQLVAKESQPYPGWHAHTIIYQVAALDARPVKKPLEQFTKYQSLYFTCWSSAIASRPSCRQVLRSLTKLSSTNASLKSSKLSSRKSSAGIRI